MALQASKNNNTKYISNKKHRMKVFVANRVTEILEYSNSDQWRHLPGSLNPADVASRGTIDPMKLVNSDWFKAPTFLSLNEEGWPKSIVGKLSDDDVEIKSSVHCHELVTLRNHRSRKDVLLVKAEKSCRMGAAIL